MEVWGETGARLSEQDLAGLSAVVLLRRTGTVLGAWSRDRVNMDVVSVMTATLLGSAETIAQAMQGEVPRTLTVRSEGFRLLATRLESQSILVLVGPSSMRESDLRLAARHLAPRFFENGGNGARVSSATTATPIAARRTAIPARQE